MSGRLLGLPTVNPLLHGFADFCAPGGLWPGYGMFGGLLLAGLAGSGVHCGPMCGPFVLGQVSDRLARVPAVRLCEFQRLRAAALLPYHAGRLTTYAALGAIAGVSGAAAGAEPWIGAVSALLLLAAASGFAIQALRRLAPARLGNPAGAGAWGRGLARIAGRIDRTHWRGGFLLGLALGLLPCGFLYTALAAAAATLSPAAGALAMLAFGLGTLPSLVAIGVSGRIAGRILTRLAPALLAANAAMLLLIALQRLGAEFLPPA